MERNLGCSELITVRFEFSYSDSQCKTFCLCQVIPHRFQCIWLLNSILTHLRKISHFLISWAKNGKIVSFPCYFVDFEIRFLIWFVKISWCCYEHYVLRQATLDFCNKLNQGGRSKQKFLAPCDLYSFAIDMPIQIEGEALIYRKCFEFQLVKNFRKLAHLSSPFEIFLTY